MLDDGASVLVIDSAEIVLNEIEFEQEGEECESGRDDNCAEAETGPMVVALPTDGSVAQQILVEIAPGTYDAVECAAARQASGRSAAGAPPARGIPAPRG